MYSQDWEFLGHLNIHILEIIRKYLLISTVCRSSSSLNINLNNNEKLVEMCKIFGANKFLVKPGTNDYHPSNFFKDRGIGLKYFDYNYDEYNQVYDDFIPRLSIIDLIMNCGPNKSKSYLLKFKNDQP